MSETRSVRLLLELVNPYAVFIFEMSIEFIPLFIAQAAQEDEARSVIEPNMRPPFAFNIRGAVVYDDDWP